MTSKRDLEMASQLLLDAMTKYNDDIRHPLVIENPDWDLINIFLGLWAEALDNPSDEEQRNARLQILRFIIEYIYVKGVEYGRINGN